MGEKVKKGGSGGGRVGWGLRAGGPLGVCSQVRKHRASFISGSSRDLFYATLYVRFVHYKEVKSRMRSE